MLLANMAKSDSFSRLHTLMRFPVLKLSASRLALDQLVDLFNRGADAHYNSSANFDYLAYLFADLAMVRLSSTSKFNQPLTFHSIASENNTSPTNPVLQRPLSPSPHGPYSLHNPPLAHPPSGHLLSSQKHRTRPCFPRSPTPTTAIYTPTVTSTALRT